MALPLLYPRVNSDDMVAMGFDPGASDKDAEIGHCGVALACRYFVDESGPTGNGHPEWRLESPGWRVYQTAEMAPEDFMRWFVKAAPGIDMLYGEMFRPDKKRAMLMVGSTMPVSQLIGWTRHHIKMFEPHIDATWQSNMVLTGPTAAILREKGIKPVSPKGANAAKGSTGDHQRSAELHLWHGLMRAGLVDGVAL